MNFASDNVSGVSPSILEAIARVNHGQVRSYGADALSRGLEAHFAELFECGLRVLPVATGTAANALSLAMLSPPWGAVLCHENAHVIEDEANAPEFYSGGAKLVALPGEHGRLKAATVAEALPAGLGDVHHPQPSALTLTQATEAGTVYGAGDIADLAAAAHAHGLAVHMDGARFANAVAHLGSSPADLTWRAGVDVLSFGATKNGALAAEAIIVFDTWRPKDQDRNRLLRDLEFRIKRAGHLWSKARFVAAQLDAYLADGLWLRNAAQANAMAQRLARGLCALPGVALKHPVEANEIFLTLPPELIDGLEAAGFIFYRWGKPAENCIRLVTAFDTQAPQVDAFLACAASIKKP